MSKSARSIVTASVLAVGLGVVLAAFSLLVEGPPAVARPVPRPEPRPHPQPTAARPRVEVVFVLDTTSSMTGLIEGAKRKIWSIADFIARGQPAPELRVGLVAFRDRGDAYVTKVFDLSTDIDRVFLDLRELRAEGGGDSPEHVGKALHDAIDSMSWSKDQGVMKTIYLVGDAPPQEYQDGFSVGTAAKKALARGIVINAIRCGGDPSTEQTFTSIAKASGGDFSSIAQDGAVAVVVTPYDAKLAALSDRLTATSMGYGSGGARRANEAKMGNAYALPAPAKADRAALLATKGKAVDGDDDLVAAVGEGRARLEDLKDEELPAELQAVAPAARAEVVARKKAEREHVLKEIDELSRKRAEFVRAEEAKKPAGPSFDGKVRDSLKRQARDHGLTF